VKRCQGIKSTTISNLRTNRVCLNKMNVCNTVANMASSFPAITKSSNEMNPLCWPHKGIQTPHANDVLYGRGGGTNHHPGNRRYRALVKAKTVCYNNAIRPERGSVAHQIVRDWRTTQQPPGRFLKFNEKSGMWDDVGDAMAREKTAQLFREVKASELRLKKRDNSKNCGKGAEDVITQPKVAAMKGKLPHTSLTRSQQQAVPKVKQPLYSEKGEESHVTPTITKVDLPNFTPIHVLEFDEPSSDDDFSLDGFTWGTESAIPSQTDANQQVTPNEDHSDRPISVIGNFPGGICMNSHTKVVGPMFSTPLICNECVGHGCRPGRFSSSSHEDMTTGMDASVGEIGLLHVTQLDESVASNGFHRSLCQGEYLPVELDGDKANSHDRLVPMLKDNPRMNASDKMSHLSKVHECTPNVDNAAQELEPIELATPILLRGHGQGTAFSSTSELSPPPNSDPKSARLRQWSSESQSFVVEQDLTFPPLILQPDNNVTFREFKDIDTVSKVPTTTVKRKASDQIGSETIKRVFAGLAVKQPSMSNLNLHPEDQVEQSFLIETTSDLRNLIKGLQANEPLHLSPSHRKSSIESLLRVLTLMERHHFPTSSVNK